MTDSYAKGNMNNEHYKNLKDEISVHYEEVFKKRINSLNSLVDKDNGRLLEMINDDIRDAYANGKLNELHYNLLNNIVSRYEDNLHTNNKS